MQLPFVMHEAVLTQRAIGRRAGLFRLLQLAGCLLRAGFAQRGACDGMMATHPRTGRHNTLKGHPRSA